jgi:hypothetical protein
MVQVRQCFLKRAIGGSILCALLAARATTAAPKFYPDDPLLREPRPMPVSKLLRRPINEYYDFFRMTFFEPAQEKRESYAPSPSEAINTLGEVPDSAWYTNRVGSRLLSIAELVRGPGTSNAPAEGRWTVISGKTEGITPGLVFKDSAGRTYFLKFDPKSNPELASAADVLGSKFFYALGYNVPENYVVRFQPSRFVVDDKAKYRDSRGFDRPMQPRDVDDILARVARHPDGSYRAVASLMVPGEPIGPFRYYGTRTDDPNDIVPHERRRDLRGLFVFSAWLNHTDSKSLNSLDTVVEEEGVRFVKHFLIDFGAILGSDSFEAKSPRAGNVYLFDFKPAAWQFLSLGLQVPEWMRANYPDIPSVGHLEFKIFQPEQWKNNYPNPAFDLRTPGDTFWAAKKVMAFRDQEIRAIVETAQYSDPEATDWVTRCLIERRNKIGRAFFDDVLPLDNFSLRNGKLVFEDLGLKYGFHAARRYSVQWAVFDNQTQRLSPISGATTFDVPRSPALYLAAQIRGKDPDQTVTVYLRKDTVVGIDRT